MGHEGTFTALFSFINYVAGEVTGFVLDMMNNFTPVFIVLSVLFLTPALIGVFRLMRGGV